MNENPCSNQEIRVLSEHGFEVENTKNDVFVCENVAYSYDVVTTL